MRAIVAGIFAVVAVSAFANDPSSDIRIAATIGVPSATPPSSAPKPQQDSELVMQLLRNKEFDKALDLATRMVKADPKDPVALNLQGGAYLGKQDYDSARRSFDTALKLQPDNAQVLLNLAQLDLRDKDVAGARKRYQAVLAKDPKNLPAMIGLAQLETNAGNTKEAVSWLEKAKAASPDAPGPRMLLASHHMRTKNNAAAIAELTAVRRTNPDNAEVLDMLGQAQLASGKNADAVATYTKLAALQPSLPMAQFRLAVAQAANEDVAGATESLKKAIQLKPDFEEAVTALALLEVKAGRPAEAIKLARDFQQRFPASPAGLSIEGDVLAVQGQSADAAKSYEKAYGVRPSAILAIKYHATQTKAGNAAGADSLLQQWLKSHPDDAGALIYLGTENLLQGQNKQAIERFELVLAKSPDNVVVLNNLANAYYREKDPRALATAERASKLAPDAAGVSDTLGWILVEQGNTKRGLELIQAAAKKDPKNPEIQYHLAVALGKAGNKAQARRVLESLLAGDQRFPQREAAQQLMKQL